jgi:hypothetical protein
MAKRSLAGAFARVDRADRHIDELKLLIERYRKSQEDKMIAQEQATTKRINELFRFSSGDTFSTQFTTKVLSDFPVDAAVIVGEVIYNLRAALDYLVYELAWQDSGSEKGGTQFLIEDHAVDPKRPKKRGFIPLSKFRLAGFHQHHIDAMQNLQPYMGCTWTKTLRDISNPDKHRQLTAVGGNAESTAVIEYGVSGSLNDRSGQVLRGVSADHPDTHIDLQYAIKVTLPDGTEIVKTLEILKREVRATLDAFKPEFK